MNCEQARLSIGSDPQALTPELAQHLEGCPACTRYRAEMVSLDRDVRRALSLPPPLSDPQRAPVAHRPILARSRWALAASVLLMAAVALVLFTVRPTDTLAQDVITHVANEPQSWSSPAPVPPGELDRVLSRAGVARAADAAPVSYAQTCWFRNSWVPHLVVRTAHGPYTVLVLRGTQVPKRRHFNDGTYSGLLVPVKGGTFAILGRGSASPDAAADEISHSLTFLH